MTLALAIPIGLLIGLTMGALGGGGSILAVPALVYLLDQNTQAATTGSLLIVGITALVAMVAHYRAGRVRVAQGVVFGVLGIAGSYIGSQLSVRVVPNVLLAAFSVLILVVAAMMFARSRRGQGGLLDAQGASGQNEAPVITLRPSFTCAWSRLLKVLLTASAVGLLTGFFGVGGGFAAVPALVLVLGFSMPVAVGTSLLVIAINSASAVASRVGHGVHLDWTLLGVFTLAAIVGSLFGGRLCARVRPERLTAAFTVLLVVVGMYTAARSFPQLV